MHLEQLPPGWTRALTDWPAYGLVKSVSNPDTLREARSVWAALGRPASTLPTIYRYFFDDYPNFDSPHLTLAGLRSYWRDVFARFVDRTYLERCAAHIDGVETLNEHTDTRMVADKALLRGHLLAEQAAVDVWNGEYRGRVVRSRDGGEGLIPASCRLVLVNGPVGNDIPREFMALAIQSDSWLGYHNYSFYPGGVAPADEWVNHSGRWVAMEQAAGLRPTWAFTEGGPYLDTGRGWRSPEVFGGDVGRLAAALAKLARETSATDGAREGRVVGPTALFTTGGWPGYHYEADDLVAAGRVFVKEWRAAAPGDNAMLDAKTKAAIHAHLDAAGLLVDGPLYQARATRDLVVRDRAGDVVKDADEPQGRVVRAGSTVEVWKDGQTVGAYKDRAYITPEGLNVWTAGNPPSLVKL